MKSIDYTNQEMQIMSLPFVEKYLSMNFPNIVIESVTPFSFTIGSNNQGEDIENSIDFQHSLFFGVLQICINPNGSDLQPEKIELKYRSYLNHKPFIKTITRIVETENMINEASESKELFDNLEISQTSTVYDFYVTFFGFKIDYK